VAAEQDIPAERPQARSPGLTEKPGSQPDTAPGEDEEAREEKQERTWREFVPSAQHTPLPGAHTREAQRLFEVQL
jgi:hypothetical protein